MQSDWPSCTHRWPWFLKVSQCLWMICVRSPWHYLELGGCKYKYCNCGWSWVNINSHLIDRPLMAYLTKLADAVRLLKHASINVIKVLVFTRNPIWLMFASALGPHLRFVIRRSPITDLVQLSLFIWVTALLTSNLDWRLHWSWVMFRPVTLGLASRLSIICTRFWFPGQKSCRVCPGWRIVIWSKGW